MWWNLWWNKAYFISGDEGVGFRCCFVVVRAVFFTKFRHHRLRRWWNMWRQLSWAWRMRMKRMLAQRRHCNGGSFESTNTDTSKHLQTRNSHRRAMIRGVCLVWHFKQQLFHRSTPWGSCHRLQWVHAVVCMFGLTLQAAAFSFSLVNSVRIMPSTTMSSCSCFPCACNGCVS